MEQLGIVPIEINVKMVLIQSVTIRAVFRNGLGRKFRNGLGTKKEGKG